MAEKTKASSGVIAAVAVLVLCILFPRSTWGYIFFIVGGIWIYRLLFASTSKPPASEELSQVKTGAAARTSNRSARATEQPVTAQMPNVSSSSASGVAAARFVPDDHPVSSTPNESLLTGTVPLPLAATASSRRYVDEDVPVPVVAKESPKPAQFSIPPAPAQIQAHTGIGRWIPPGESISIAGSLITGGMIYVGKDLKSLSGITEPCLINPTLSIAAQGSVREREFGYWPSFSEISPRARRAYLNWLADGRRDPEADIGYVFLFFYGLERSATVSNGIGWDNQVAEARRQRTEAEELMRSAAPVYSRTPQASQSPLSADTKAQCSALNERVAMLDSMGRAGSRYYDLDWVRSERKKARDEQYRLRC